jgi:hypothetical protein
LLLSSDASVLRAPNFGEANLGTKDLVGLSEKEEEEEEEEERMGVLISRCALRRRMELSRWSLRVGDRMDRSERR